MEDQSYIKLFRSMLDWDWWDDLSVRSLWITILLMANWKDKKWRGIVIKKGSFFTSLDHLSKKAGLSVQKTRTALNKLKSTGEITYQSTNHGTLITVENWEKFQVWELESTSDPTSNSTNEQQTANKRSTNDQQQLKKDKKDKKDKKEKEYISAIRSEFEKLWEEYPKKQGKKAALKSYEKARRNDAATYEQIKKGMEDYIAFVKAENRDLQYVKQGSTFFSQEAWKDDWSVKNGNNNFRGSDQGGGSMAGGASAGGAGSFRFRDSD